MGHFDPDETLIALTTRDLTFHAGTHAKQIPAGTEVVVENPHDRTDLVRVSVVGRPRVKASVTWSALRCP